MVGLRDWLPLEVTQESQNGLLCRTFGCDWRAGLSAARKFTNAQRLNECIIQVTRGQSFLPPNLGSRLDNRPHFPLINLCPARTIPAICQVARHSKTICQRSLSKQAISGQSPRRRRSTQQNHSCKRPRFSNPTLSPSGTSRRAGARPPGGPGRWST